MTTEGMVPAKWISVYECLIHVWTLINTQHSFKMMFCSIEMIVFVNWRLRFLTSNKWYTKWYVKVLEKYPTLVQGQSSFCLSFQPISLPLNFLFSQEVRKSSIDFWLDFSFLPISNLLSETLSPLDNSYYRPGIVIFHEWRLFWYIVHLQQGLCFQICWRF